MSVTDDFDQFFASTTGLSHPYPFQSRIAEDGFPDIIQAPTGSGKTMAVIVPWLFRLLRHPDPAVRAATPRRLVIAFPMRTLVEQTEAEARAALRRAGVDGRVQLRVLMGGTLKPSDLQQWRVAPHAPTIVIGTVDSIVSRMLNRGYGCTRPSYPIDFALMTNDVQIVIDEVQLASQATATLRQIAAFAREWGSVGPVGLTCMSATVIPEALDVVDNPLTPDSSRIAVDLANPGSPELAKRIQATRLVQHMPAEDAKSLAQVVLENHHEGSLTVVMLNTIEGAVETYKAVQKVGTTADLVLVHSRFRGIERRDATARAVSPDLPPGGRIVFSTQALEAGVDIDARTLITEAAPWTSIIQRAGRCNRTGNQPDARLIWFDAWKKHPYEANDVRASQDELSRLEGQQVSGSYLRELEVEETKPELTVLRRIDLLGLFDTSHDLLGGDVDVTRFIRADDQMDLQVAWIDTSSFRTQTESGVRVSLPSDGLRCPVSLGAFADYRKRRPDATILHFSASESRWVPLRAGERVNPQNLLLIDRQAGGYSRELGFQPASREAVENPPETDADSLIPESEGPTDDPGAHAGAWVSLRQHLEETRQQAAAFIQAIGVPQKVTDPGYGQAVIAAAALHDWGKASPIWQQALLEGADPPDEGEPPYAKSPRHTRLRFIDTKGQPLVGFRHEFVSLLMLGGTEGADAMSAAGVPPTHHGLCRYLVGAHHGLIRLQPHDPLTDGRTGTMLLGVRESDEIPLSPFERSATRRVSLREFNGGPDGWSDTSLRLLQQWGPFRLAYAEMLVRMADWRASAGYPLASEEVAA